MTNSKNEEKQKNTKRRLLLLILLLAISVICLTVTTYAWFTSNKRVSVEDLQVNVSAVNGLQISADAESWDVTVPKSEFLRVNTDLGGNNQLPKYMSNVSTAGEVENGLMKMFYGKVEEIPEDRCDETDSTRCYYLSAQDITNLNACVSNEENNCSDAYFMAFDIYLKLDGNHPNGVDLYLTSNADVVKDENERDYGIKNTARVAFIDEGYVTKEDYLTAVDDENVGDTVRSLNQGTKSLIWEPNYDKHTEAAYDNAVKYGLVRGSTELYQCKGIKNTFENMKLYDTYDDSKNGDNFAIQDIAIATKADRTEQVSFPEPFKLKVGVTKLRVYFWVEGQDIDTENNAAGYKMSLNLQFAIA